MRSRLFKITDFGTNRKRVCDFQLVHNSNLGPILHRFGDSAGFLRSRVTPPLFRSIFGVFPMHQMAHVGVSQSRGYNLFGREIIFEEFQHMWSRYLNVIDRRTDGRTRDDGNTALCTKVHRAVKRLQKIGQCWEKVLKSLLSQNICYCIKHLPRKSPYGLFSNRKLPFYKDLGLNKKNRTYLEIRKSSESTQERHGLARTRRSTEHHWLVLNEIGREKRLVAHCVDGRDYNVGITDLVSLHLNLWHFGWPCHPLTCYCWHLSTYHPITGYTEYTRHVTCPHLRFFTYVNDIIVRLNLIIIIIILHRTVGLTGYIGRTHNRDPSLLAR